MRTQAAAGYLNLTQKTLERMRVEGRGPSFRKHGRVVVYTQQSLDAWSAKSERGSTSEQPKAA
jgi:hypothetical protein